MSAGQVLVGADEALLAQVEGVVRVTEHPVRKGVDLALLALDERGERLLVASSSQTDEPGLVGRHVSPSRRPRQCASRPLHECFLLSRSTGETMGKITATPR